MTRMASARHRGVKKTQSYRLYRCGGRRLGALFFWARYMYHGVVSRLSRAKLRL